MGVVIVMIVVCAGILDWYSDQATTPTQTPVSSRTPSPARESVNKSYALVKTQQFVKDRLAAPRTAKWPGMFDNKLDHVTYSGKKRYCIRSWAMMESQGARMTG